MMNRRELVRLIVLNEICDDYENLHQITKQVGRVTSACGMSIATHEILEALRELVESGLAKAYELSPWSPTKVLDRMPPVEEIGSPDESRIGDVYFWITKKGMQVHMQDCAEWPFDDDNVLRPGWKPPES